MSDFFRKHGLILSEVFWYTERSKNLEKEHFITAQKVIFLRRFDRRNAFFEISRNLIRKGCFQMSLNARQSPEDIL